MATKPPRLFNRRTKITVPRRLRYHRSARIHARASAFPGVALGAQHGKRLAKLGLVFASDAEIHWRAPWNKKLAAYSSCYLSN
jgi:hypothetical protein